MTTLVRPTLAFLSAFTILLGVVYPVAVTLGAQALFPQLSQGSLVRRQGQVVGSRLIGQAFDDPRYFWGRPSPTSPYPYNASASAGSNLGPTNPALQALIESRVAALRTSDPSHMVRRVPVDLVTGSASGLDPDISPTAALFQVPRVALYRKMPEAALRALVSAKIRGRTWGLFGEARVNVLDLNLALDGLAPPRA